MSKIELNNRSEIQYDAKVSGDELVLTLKLSATECVIVDSGDVVFNEREVANTQTATVTVKVTDENDPPVRVYSRGVEDPWTRTTASPYFSYRTFTVVGLETYGERDDLYVVADDAEMLPKGQIIVIKRRDVP